MRQSKKITKKQMQENRKFISKILSQSSSISLFFQMAKDGEELMKRIYYIRKCMRDYLMYGDVK